MRFAILIFAMLASCGGAPVAAVEETPASSVDEVPVPEPTAEPEPEGVKPIVKDPPEGERRQCSVTDSNGPDEGGEKITSGCAEGEICVCEAQAGYSCSGYCRAGSSVGIVGVPEKK